MKNSPYSNIACGLALASILGGELYAQGSIDPPDGPPAPTMKSLQQIWNKIGELEAQNNALQEQLKAVTAHLDAAMEIEMVTVGNPGNAPDTTGDPNPAGAVNEEFRIGKFEVTNAQYVQFLNAVAATDPNGLYAAGMATNARGGITQSGAPGSYTYTVRPNMRNKPVTLVSWYDALRFCNWLHNGRPVGIQDGSTTEHGAYTLTGPTSIAAGNHPLHGGNGRNFGARYWLPSEDEWYKAAYHEPGATGPDDYWIFPSRRNGPPRIATADLYGNINNDTATNYNFGADWNGQNGNVTTVGSGGVDSACFYGAFDMGGNVFEWTEQAEAGSTRVRRGGSFSFSSNFLNSSNRSLLSPTFADAGIGFRVAGAAP